jgi:hypothetical protein
MNNKFALLSVVTNAFSLRWMIASLGMVGVIGAGAIGYAEHSAVKQIDMLNERLAKVNALQGDSRRISSSASPRPMPIGMRGRSRRR